MLSISIQAVVLAAGKSKRFNTGSSKLLENICGQPLITYPLQVLNRLEIPTTMVIGHEAESIKKVAQSFSQRPISFCFQDQQLGTGHALAQSKPIWHAHNIVVINGDMPLITTHIIEQLIEKHIKTDATVTFVTAHSNDPHAPYGKVIQHGQSVKIIEAKDINQQTYGQECCINAGIYIFKRSFLEHNIAGIANNNASQEYYITDLVNLASNQNNSVHTISAPFDAIRGINTLKELWAAEQIKRSELIADWMDQGVRFSFAQSTHIDANISIGGGTLIGAGVHLLNGSSIGKNCIIEPFCMIKNAQIADNVTIYSHSVVEGSSIEYNCKIGPFARIRDNAVIKKQSVIGNFVEIARSSIGDGTKIKHLTYCGDTTTGSNVNIGAGTITCNYDGIQKHQTTIADNVFVGSNNTLIAPVTIGSDSYTAAGSVIAEDVPQSALAIGRTRQINKPGYATNLRKNKHDQNYNIAFFGAIKTHNDIT